jgi:hypothetical protein
MDDWLWTVTPYGQPPAAHTAWTTFQVAHTAHSHDDEVVLFSIIKRSCFRLSRFRRKGPSGPLFDNQMGLFWVDKNSRWSHLRHVPQP